MNILRKTYCSLLLAVLGHTSFGQLPDIATGDLSIEAQTVANRLSAPIEIVSAHDGTGRLFIAEQGGRILILENGIVNATPFLDISNQIASGGEAGLLGFAFHPGYNNPASPGFHRFYTYTTQTPAGPSDFTVPMAGAPDSRCVLTEWQVSPNSPDLGDLSSRRDVLRIAHPQSNHNGGKIAFRPSDGYLYIAIGDGGSSNDVGDGHTLNLGNGQDTSNLLGKILRIDPLAPNQNPGSSDPLSGNALYRNPASNPFIAGGGLKEIYAYGFRNPFRFGFDEVTDRLLVGDVGQNTIEEVDMVEKGKNYGWNRKEGSFLFDPANGNVSADPNPSSSLTNPILEYDHDDGISVIGGFVYRGTAIPLLVGQYVFGDYSNPANGSGRLFHGNLSTGTIQEFRLGGDPRALGLNVKSFGEDEQHEIYVVADGAGAAAGKILKIVPIPAAPALLNLSSRARVETDDGGYAIAGFIVTGSTAKTFVLRARGPSLAIDGHPLPNSLTNPTLSLRDQNNQEIIGNDDWMTTPRKQELIDFGLAPTDALESAIVVTLAPGTYTAIMHGVGDANGIGLVELFDVTRDLAANAVNLSTRARVQTGDNILIGGLIIGGDTNERVILRAIGPSLTTRGVAGALANPTLELVDSSGTRLAFNDNWRSDQETEISATDLAPSDDAESAIVSSLAPGNYTAIVRGAGDTSGVALVEVYRLNPLPQPSAALRGLTNSE